MPTHPVTSHGPHRGPLALRVGVAVLVALGCLRCTAAGSPEPGPTSADADRVYEDGGYVGDAGFPAPSDGGAPPNQTDAGVALSVVSDRVVLINAHDTLPAFRICPSVTADGGPTIVSSGSMLPLPTTQMPGSSLAGVDAQGAAFLDADREFSGRDFVLLLIDAETKGNESFKTGACSALACANPGAGGSACLPIAKRVAVRLPSSGLLTKPGTLLVVTGKSNTDVKVTTQPALNGSAAIGKLQLQLVNVSAYDGGTTYESTPLNPSLVNAVSLSSYGDRIHAGDHAETLLQIHQSSNPHVPITTHFGSSGVYALVLVGTDAPDAGKPLKFLAMPLLQ